MTQANDFGEFKTILTSASVDLAIVDVDHLNEDDVALMKMLRAHTGIGIVLVSHRNASGHSLSEWEDGSDAPSKEAVDARQLPAYVEAALRRCLRVCEERHVIHFAGCRLDYDARTLTGPSGTEHRLMPGEFHILTTLLENPGRVVSREELRRAGADSTIVSRRTVDVQVSRLRRKVEDNSVPPSVLVSVRGAGYAFVKAVG